jgi:hypothetical protein
MLYETTVRVLLALLAVYAAAGTLFAVPFALGGVAAIDAAAARSGGAFRLIIVPGVIALWPLLLVRWIRQERHT